MAQQTPQGATVSPTGQSMVQGSSNAPAGTPASSYLNVMSKAGAPTPRPQVPNRQVGLPPETRAYYSNYYYGYPRGYYNNGQGTRQPSAAPPGYDTKTP